jgi:AcrR family transcriptional regulator
MRMTQVNAEPPRRGRPRSDRARRAILESTRAELAAHGYERLSIQQIADAAGVGKQTIYRWWPTKRELVAACVLEGLVLPDDVGLPDTGDVRADLRTWVRALVVLFGGSPQTSLLRALVSAAAESDEVAAKLRARFGDPYRSAVVARLTAARRAGVVRRGAPLAAVAEALVGALLFRVLAREPVGADEMVALADALFAGIERPTRPA